MVIIGFDASPFRFRGCGHTILDLNVPWLAGEPSDFIREPHCWFEEVERYWILPGWRWDGYALSMPDHFWQRGGLSKRCMVVWCSAEYSGLYLFQSTTVQRICRFFCFSSPVACAAFPAKSSLRRVIRSSQTPKNVDFGPQKIRFYSGISPFRIDSRFDSMWDHCSHSVPPGN